MVYLIENSNYYKIGYTDDLFNRLSGYRTHNPTDVIVVDIIECAGKNEEKQLHNLLEKYKHRNKNKEVLNIWKDFKFKFHINVTFKNMTDIVDKNIYLTKENEKLREKTIYFENELERLSEKIEQYLKQKENYTI